MKLKEIQVSEHFIFRDKIWKKLWESKDGLEHRCLCEGMAEILPPDLIVEKYEINESTN